MKHMGVLLYGSLPVSSLMAHKVGNWGRGVPIPAVLESRLNTTLERSPDSPLLLNLVRPYFDPNHLGRFVTSTRDQSISFRTHSTTPFDQSRTDRGGPSIMVPRVSSWGPYLCPYFRPPLQWSDTRKTELWLTAVSTMEGTYRGCSLF